MVSRMRAGLLFLLLACAAGKPQAPAGPPAKAASEASAASEAKAAECASDADCALTWVGEGSCCANQCAPRPVTAAHAAELNEAQSKCRRPCPQLSCAPPRMHSVAACEAGRCVAKAMRSDD